MKLQLFLVRHAEAETNVNPLFQGEVNGLTNKGQEQARAVARTLQQRSIDALYTSNALRARSTAEEITRATGTQPTELALLKERACTFTSPTEYHFAEPFEDFLPRLQEAVSFFEQRSTKRTVVVSHAIFFKLLVAYLLLGPNASEEQFLKTSDAFIVDHASVSTLEYTQEKRRWRILSWNEQTHPSYET